MMAYHDLQQLNPFQNPLSAWLNPQIAQGYGLGQSAYGQQFGQYGGQQFGQPNIGGWGQGAGWGGQPAWGQNRQLSQYEVGDVVRQLVPLLPQILAQAQQQPQGAYGYGAYGQGQGGYGQFSRPLTQQDVNEVVRQILPIVPQIVGMLQGQGPLQAAAIYGGLNPQLGAQNPFGQLASFSTAQTPLQQQPFGQQQGWPQAMAAFGGAQQAWGQRQLTQQDVGEVVRQLVAVIPQVIGNLQGQQRPF